MALTQPTLYSQAAFDATQEHIFSFNVVGGDQVVANTLTIIENSTNTVVYSQRQETFTLTHILAANSLINGEYYAASVITENSNGDVSVVSNTIQFYCYTEPSLVFTNLVSGANLTNSSYNFEMSYSQSESEALEQYSFNLYDYSFNLVSTSGILYTNTSDVPFTAQYTFTGLLNSTNYYVECTGITVGGTQITTGLISFGVNYNTSYTKLNLTNNCLEGYVYVTSNPVTIFGYSNPENPIYIESGEEVYVNSKNDGYYVLWDNGFTTSTTDWTLSIWGKNFNENKTLCILSNNNNDKITLDYKIENNRAYILLSTLNYNSPFSYVIFSDSIPQPEPSDNIMVWVRRINNIYDVYIMNLGG